MDEQRFQRLMELFGDVLERPASEWDRLLAGVREDDPDLADQLAELLEAHRNATGVLDHPEAVDEMLDAPTRECSAPPSSGDRDQLVGATIGPYRLLSPLGAGGMGVVYRAEQTEPIRREVALKLVRTGFDSGEILARFEAERQTLARMTHPNIAQVFDAGTTTDGAPYFVMELVDGPTLTAYCDRHRLSVAARVELFATVCEAVQHAHRRGVIHRDLKPANVLVAEVDGSPVPKVIDFGVAKAVTAGEAEAGLTHGRQLLGTPEYMSPEQWEGRGDLDTRTDVYSLGILLYRLLVGVAPLEGIDAASWPVILKRLTLEDIPAPSSRVSRLGDSAEEIARRRSSTSAALHRTLRGDLDWIVQTAVARAREDRYDSAAELADELRRFLAREPLVRPPPGRLYAVGKLARRHRGPAAAALAVVLSLAAGLVATSVALVESRRSRAEAEDQAAIATEVIRFLNEDLLGAATPERADGREVTVREVVEEAAAELDEGFSGPPRVEAEIRASLGRVLFTLGRYEEASTMWESALALRERVLGADHPETIASAVETAIVRRQTVQLDEAEQLLTDVLERADRVLGPDHPHALSGLRTLASVLLAQGRLQQAVTVLRDLIERRSRVFGAQSLEVAEGLNNLGDALVRLGRYDEGLEAIRTSHEIHREQLGPDHLRTVTAAQNRATVLASEGRFAEAAPLLRETLAPLRRVLGPDHDRVRLAMLNLGSVLSRLGRHDESEPMLREALAGLQRTLGPRHATTLAAQRALAADLDRQGRSAEAVGLFEAAIAGARRALPADHWYLGAFLNEYGLCLTHLDRLEEADAALEESWAILEPALDPGHRHLVETATNGLALQRRRHDERGLELWEERLRRASSDDPR